MATNKQYVDPNVGESRRFSWIRQSEAAENDADQPDTSNAKIPMTAAQRQRKHRLTMKKNQTVEEISAAKPPPQSGAERQRKYRQRRRALEQSSSTVAVLNIT